MNEHVAGRELDAEIAEKVMGWTTYETYVHGPMMHGGAMQWLYRGAGIPGPNGQLWGVESFRPSTSIADAWLVVEAMHAKGWNVECRTLFDGFAVDFDNLSQTFAARVDPREGGMPLAICRAALAAVASSPQSAVGEPRRAG